MSSNDASQMHKLRIKVSKQDICIVLYNVSAQAAHVNEGSHSFTCHPNVYPYME